MQATRQTFWAVCFLIFSSVNITFHFLSKVSDNDPFSPRVSGCHCVDFEGRNYLLINLGKANEIENVW